MVGVVVQFNEGEQTDVYMLETSVSTVRTALQKSKADGKSWLWKRAVAVAFKKSPFVFDVNFEVLGIS